MKILAGWTAVLGGILLVVVPRFVFPSCEALGRGRMHCTDLAHGEYVIGALLTAAGVLLLALNPGRATLAAATLALLLSGAAAFMPAYTRYCMNPDMACRYGMAPSVRFIGAACGLVQLAAIVGFIRSRTRRAS